MDRARASRAHEEFRRQARSTAAPRPAARIPARLAAAGRHRRAHGRGGRHAQGDGVRDDRRPAGAGRPLHGVRADGGLRAARHLAAAERQHDDDDRDPDGGGARPGGPGRRRRRSSPRRATLAVLVGAHAGRWPRVLRLGFVANFISEPVLVGFKSGIGLVIVVDQMPKLLGVHIDKAGFFRDIVSIVQHLPRDVAATLAVGGRPCSSLIFVLERFLPRAPAPLIAVAAGDRGIGAARPAGRRAWRRSARFRAGLPALRAAAARRWSRQLWPAALGIALMSFTETIAAGRAFAAPSEPRPAPNRELLALGLANVGGRVLRRDAGRRRHAQTAVNRLRRRAHADGGARHGRGGARDAAAAGAADRPDAARRRWRRSSSSTRVGLIQPEEFREIRRVRTHGVPLGARSRSPAWSLLGTLQGHPGRGHRLAAVARLPGVQPAGLRARPQARAPTSSDRCRTSIPTTRPGPGLLILRIEGRIFFANAQRVGDKMWPLVERGEAAGRGARLQGGVRHRVHGAQDARRGRGELRRDGVELWLAGLNPAVFAMVERSRLGETLGRERMFFNMQAAVDRFQSRKT